MENVHTYPQTITPDVAGRQHRVLRNTYALLALSDPAVLPAAVLLRAMVPFEPAAVPQLGGHRIWIGAGRADPIVPPEHGERLAALFRRGGADVTLDWRDAGHNLVPEEVAAAAHWLGPA